MKLIETLFLLALFVVSTAIPVFAQGARSEWTTFNNEVIELYRAGKLDQAAIVARICCSNGGWLHHFRGLGLRHPAIDHAHHYEFHRRRRSQPAAVGRPLGRVAPHHAGVGDHISSLCRSSLSERTGCKPHVWPLSWQPLRTSNRLHRHQNCLVDASL